MKMNLAARSDHKVNSAVSLCDPLSQLCSIFKNCFSIEAYVEEFLLYSHVVHVSGVNLIQLLASEKTPAGPWHSLLTLSCSFVDLPLQ